jgi:hypothetical protein
LAQKGKKPMALMDKNGRLFGRFNVLDTAVASLIGLMVLGVFVVQSGLHTTSGQVVEGESDIQIHVQISDFKTLDPQLFVPGNATHITIRNQPRGDVTITSAQCKRIQVSLGNGAVANDAAEPNGHECFVVLRDHALVTKDGYVTEGVKVKVGLGIELEGFKYRVYGRITDVLPAAKAPQ